MDTSNAASRVPADDEPVADDLPECQDYLAGHWMDVCRDPSGIAVKLCELFLEQVMHFAGGRAQAAHYISQESMP
jgi:hypothetical protein